MVVVFFLFPQPSFKQIWFINVHLGCQSYKNVLYMSFVTKNGGFSLSAILQRIWFAAVVQKNQATVHRLGGSGSLFDRIYQHPHLRYLARKNKVGWNVGVGRDFFWGAFLEGFMNDLNDLCVFFWGGWGPFVNLVFWGVLMFLWCSWIRSWWCWHTKW